MNIMNKALNYLLVLILGLTSLTACQEQSSETNEKKSPKEKRIADALKDNFERTKDLDLGYPPVERLTKAIEQTKKLQRQLTLTKNKFTKARFRERGPNNIGGRTRTMLIDKNDPTGRTVFAGGVSGGLFKTNDITAQNPNWQVIDDYLNNLSVGIIAQDPDNPNIMYTGTGELYARAVGYGIYKSVDAGATWESLVSTITGGLSGSFQFVQDIDFFDGVLYAGTHRGLYRSFDGGESWAVVLRGVVHEIHWTETGWIYVSIDQKLLRSRTGALNSWEDLSTNSGFPTNLARVEFDICKNDQNIIYLIGNINGSASNIYKSFDQGLTWTNQGIPRSAGGESNFARGQGNYNLTIAVDPFDCNHVIVGGIDLYESRVGGNNSWRQLSHWSGGFGLPYVHADHHFVFFDREREGVSYYGNDGGVWRSTGSRIFERNSGLNITQFYSGALHPDTFSNYILGGTQDNYSLQMNGNGISGARIVNGGDGMLCHIDQNEPQYQVVSSQFGNYVLTVDGGNSFGGGAFVNGSFVNPSDYDNDANILYAQTFDADLARWPIPSVQVELVDIVGADLAVSFVYADPSTLDRIYLGTFDGDIYRVDNANTGSSLEAVRLEPARRGVVSSIAVQKNDPEHIIITYSNYGLGNSVMESRDGGANWVNVEGNLPDMPVRAVLFSPENAEQAIIGTEAGVWFTENLDGENTTWIPPMPGRGIPLVRTDDLQMRESDNIMLAATHGRGMFTSDVFAIPRAKLAIDRVSYVDAPIAFSGAASTNAETFLWNFGDGTNSTEEEAVHSYSNIGSYDVQLTVNDSLTDRASIKILPNKALPYERRADGYSGDFDSRPEDYGVYTISGSGFERGSSSFAGKDGTLSGDNAFVIGLNEQFYQPNSHSMLYLSNFDFSEESIYEFSFWAKYFVQDGFDGFLVEYSTDKGQNWSVLGEEQDNWYNFTNDNNLQGAAFPNGTPYFGRSRSSFTQFYLDVSFLAGQPDVAFRFVFRSNDVGNHPGLVIDDVEVKKYQGELQTDIVSLSADYSSSEEITIDWTTQPEYYATKFVIERSFNGRDFEEIGDIDPTGVITSRVQNYDFTTIGIRNLYFYRIRSLNENKQREYTYEFTTPTIVVRRDFEGVEVFRAFPNPFSNAINLTFTEVVEEPLDLELYDSAGRLILKEQQIVGDIYTQWELPELAAGVYFLSYVIGDREAKTIRLSKF